MNLVLDEADEINVKTHSKRQIGKILLKGDNITLIQQARRLVLSKESAKRRKTRHSEPVTHCNSHSD